MLQFIFTLIIALSAQYLVFVILVWRFNPEHVEGGGGAIRYVLRSDWW